MNDRITEKQLKLILVLLFTVLLSPSRAAAGDIEVTVYADNNYPPYAYEEDGKPCGIYKDILERAFSRMKGYKVTIRAVPWKRGLRHLQRGDGFALFPPYFRPAARPYIWPYSIPILEEKLVVFCRKGTACTGDKKWPQDFYGLRFGINAGFDAGGEELRNAAREGRLRLEETQGSRPNIMKLAAGHIDCYINDRISVLWEYNRIKNENLLLKIGRTFPFVECHTLSIEAGHLGVTTNPRYKFKDDFMMQFNSQILKMRNSGEIKDIVENYTRDKTL